MFEWLPDGVEFMRDVSPADWLPPIAGHDLGIRLENFMPSTFDAYARIFHPFDVTGDPNAPPPRRWADLGAERGVALSPGVSFGDVSGRDPLNDMSGFNSLAPVPGDLPQEMCATLATLLAPHTRSPETCWFCVWEGWGTLRDPEGHYFTSKRPTWRQRRRQRKKDAAEQRALDALPKISIPGRRYFLFRGPLNTVSGFEPWGSYLTVSIWWPDDHSWTVTTEIDGYTTYVGGPREAIDQILASPDLEAIEVPSDVRMD